MIKRKVLILFLILMLTISGLPVFAESDHSTTNDAKIAYSGYYYYNQNFDETMYVTLGNGKLMVAYPDDDSSYYMFVKIFSMGGVEQSSTRFQPVALYMIDDCSLYYVSDTVVYIFVVLYQSGNPTYEMVTVIKFNPTALTYTVKSSTAIDGSSEWDTSYFMEMSTILKNNANGKYYALASWSSAGVERGYVLLVEYTADTTCTQTTLMSLTTGYTNKPFWFQASVGSATAYAMFSSEALSPTYYLISLTAKTATSLVAHPESVDTWNTALGDSMHTKFYGGTYTMVNASYHVLQFTWIKSYNLGGYASYRYVNYIGFFVNMTTAGYIAGYRDSLTWSTSLANPPYGSWNYGIRTDTQHLTLFYHDYSAIIGGHALSKVVFTLTGNYYTDDLTLSYVFTQPASEDYPDFSLSADNQISIAFNMTSFYAVGFGSTETRIYYGLATVDTNFDILVTYSPADSPLITSKVYSYTITTKANGLASPQYFKIYVNDVLKGYYRTSATTGTASIPVTYMSSGIQVFVVQIYNPAVGNSSVYSETFYYNVVDADEDDEEEGQNIVFSQSINILITYLPLIAVIFLPALEGGKLFGGVGFIAGAMIGTILGTITGIVPIYVIYLLILVIVVAFVWMIKGGGSKDG